MRTHDGYRKRRKRYEEVGHARYLTFSCFRNQAFLKSERACRWLLGEILSAKSIHGFDLWAWVFMPTHVHLLIRPPPGTPVGDILSAIKEPVSKRVCAWVRFHAPAFIPRMIEARPSGRRTLRFWQPGGGYDRNIVSAEEVREKIDYIHKNPVRSGLARNPGDWVWSSYKAWVIGIDDPMPIDRHTLPPLNT
ncbi:MAG: transposase [Planctomycetota bacterium]|nr:transposase [Planctomycetota bacterium]